MRVLIIGAGLGGLTLLHGLRSAGIDAHLFERSPRDGGQPASYGIHLNADGLRALHNCLPAENWSRIDAAGVPAPNVIRFRDPVDGILSTIDKRFPEHDTDPVTKRRAISRGRLRAALLHGLDTSLDAESEPLIDWGRRFVRYEARGETVRAHFEDGGYVDGDLLVGADGSNSRVRHQRLPQVERRELGILNIAGRLPLTDDLRAALPADLTDGSINNIVPAGPGWMFLSTWNTGDPDIADVGNGARQYVVWAWAAGRNTYPDDVENYRPADLKGLVQRATTRWGAPLQHLITLTDPATVSTVPLRSMPQLPIWASTNVTLLGDAIHNMTPMAGIGANTALRDADQLRVAITSTSGSIPDGVGAYEKTMRGYANQALALSTRNATNAALGSRANRAAFRALLRIGNRVRPMKQRMFGPTIA